MRSVENDNIGLPLLINQSNFYSAYILSGPSPEAKAGSSTGSRTTEELGWETR